VPDATPERKKGREEGSFTGDELLQRRRSRGSGARCKWCSGAGERGSGSEREEAREVPGFYTGRERGKGSRRGQAADGLAIDGRRRYGIKKEVERGNRSIWRGNGRGDYDA
jgi:hypothetical protein